MKIIGLSRALIPNAIATLEWECKDEDDVGVVGSFYVLGTSSHAFAMVQMHLVKPHVTLKLVDAEVKSVNSTLELVQGFPVAMPELERHLQNGIPEWDIEIGDMIVLAVMNITGMMQNFSCSLSISNESIARDGRWWVEDRDGETLIRPVLWQERGMRTGTVMGHMRIAEVGFKPQPPQIKASVSK